MRVEGRSGPQVAIVRWFRNTMRGSGLEFGCEVMSDNPEAAAAALESAPDGKRVPVVVLPIDASKSGTEDMLPQIIVGAGTFGIDQGVALTRVGETGFRGADQARRAGSGIRDLRLRRGRLIAAPGAARLRRLKCRPLATAGRRAGRGACALHGPVGTLAGAAQTRRFMARAEGSAARGGCGFRSPAVNARPDRSRACCCPFMPEKASCALSPNRAGMVRLPAIATVLALAALAALLLSFRAERTSASLANPRTTPRG